MKEATGELNITVVTIIAIAAIAALFYAFVWPAIKGNLTASTRCASAYGCGGCNDDGYMECKGYYNEKGEATPATPSIKCQCGSTK